MSFWEANRGLLAGVGVALVVTLAVHFLVAGPSRRAAAAMEEKNAELQRRIDELTPDSGRPAPEVFQATMDERKKLNQVLAADSRTPGSVGGLLLVLPKDYVVARNADNPRFNIFERKLAASRDRCNASGIFPRYDQSNPAVCPLGFTPEVQKEEVLLVTQGLGSEREREEARVQLLLERLCATNRLGDALIEVASQGSLRVKACVQGRLRLVASPQVSRMHLRLLPITVRMTADEKALVAFAERISRPGGFLAIEELGVEVTDPKARVFNLTVQLLALVPREGPGPAKPGDQPGSRRPGQPGVPVAPIGRY
jgi:hypothetical protein